MLDDNKRILPILLLFLTACGRQGDEVLARVDSVPITAADFNRELESAPFGGGEYLHTEAGKREMLELLIRRRMVLSEAAKSPVADRPETKKKLAELDREFLRQREEARERLLVGEFLRELKEGALRVTDEDVKASWAKETEARASHILVSNETEAKEIRSRLDKGESFEALAKKHSEDPTGKKGGDLGYLMRGSLDPAFEAALFSLKNGGLAGPVASPYGFHLIKKTGERSLSERPLQESARPIRAMLENQKFQAWLADAKKRHAVSTNAAALEKTGQPLSTTR
jgi:peptidyl-prolyl cis-trans isomerase C